MKALMTFILAMSITLLTAQWYPQTSGTTENLSSICFIDDENGWAVGGNGIIIHTDDGGENWEEQFSGTDYDLNSIFLLDSSKGWIAGSSVDTLPGKILFTNNGGYTWEDQYTDSSFYIMDIFFTNSTHGWAVGRWESAWSTSGTILNTIDGGITWNRQEYSGGGLNSIYFTDLDTGWTTGGRTSPSSGYPATWICSTSDGGSTWNTQLSEVGVYSILRSVFFNDNDNGWAVGRRSIFYPPGPLPNILLTSNGGNQWDPISYNNAPLDDLELNSVFFIDNITGWAVGGCDWIIGQEYAHIIHTIDGGNNWTEQDAGTNNMLNSVYFVDPNNGWIAGAGGTILSTDNAGVSIGDISNNESNQLQIRITPNPFTTSTVLLFALDKLSNVTISIFSPQGQVIEKIEQVLPKGTHNVQWNAEELPSGIYFYRLTAGNQTSTGKLVVVR
jgi:photosystem II stability/assembly factor-like uncharacterized protein